ncbi:hypothetical protein VU01_11975 [Candidatus Electrothrix marina]|uniref:Uncharacterized protein n=1 Tax=Candidatus Electrothrix marina TaxID=1859130 RepID=A0A444JDL0_9BACT|nr:hypothetical protein VU01_11975 [Candidatus Electrothrix marina]
MTLPPRKNRTICVPFHKTAYSDIVKSDVDFRVYIDRITSKYTELFQLDISKGCLMKDMNYSKKLSIFIRRIKVNGISYTIRPSFIMPYVAGFTDDVMDALFFRKFDVPFWALAHVFGRNPMYWYRLENHIGRNSIVGTTIKRAELLPEHIAADETHTRILGNKCYIATTVAYDCILGGVHYSKCR